MTSHVFETFFTYLPTLIRYFTASAYSVKSDAAWPTLISVWSWKFKDGGPLKASFLANNQHATKKKSLKNPTSNDSLSKSAKIVLSKSILDVKN